MLSKRQCRPWLSSCCDVAVSGVACSGFGSKTAPRPRLPGADAARAAGFGGGRRCWLHAVGAGASSRAFEAARAAGLLGGALDVCRDVCRGAGADAGAGGLSRWKSVKLGREAAASRRAGGGEALSWPAAGAPAVCATNSRPANKATYILVGCVEAVLAWWC